MPNLLIALISAYALAGAQYGGPTYTTQTEPARKVTKVIAPTTVLIPAVPGRGIRDVPNIAIKYYDVSGKDFASIIQSIEKQRPRDPATKQLMAGGAGYELGASMTKVTKPNGVCTVSAAKATFTATAELPRLLSAEKLKPDQLALWRAYLSQIEEPAAAALWYVHGRIPAFEQSMIGKECSLAAKVGAAGIAQMQTDHAEFQRSFVAKHIPPQPAPAPAPAKKY